MVPSAPSIDMGGRREAENQGGGRAGGEPPLAFGFPRELGFGVPHAVANGA